MAHDERQRKRPREESSVAQTASWQPQYCASGKLLRKPFHHHLPDAVENTGGQTCHIAANSTLRFIPAKYVPEPAIVTQRGLEQIRDREFLTLSDCLRHVPSASTHPDVKSALAKHSSNFEVELFLRRLQLAVTKEGKVMTWAECGIRKSPAAALIRVSSEQSVFLFGRDRDVSDIPLDHPSCSGQHAVTANMLRFDDEPAASGEGRISGSGGAALANDDAVLHERFYIVTGLMDLNSTHGTFVNQRRLTPMKWHLLQASDVVTFGLSSRQYVAISPPS